MKIWRALILFGVFVAGANAVLLARYGSIDRAQAVLQGAGVTVMPRQGEIDVASPSQSVELKMTVINSQDVPVQILGIDSACECELHPSPPFAINAGSSQEVVITYKVSRDVGQFATTLQLLTTSPEVPIIPFRIEGRVAEPGEDN